MLTYIYPNHSRMKNFFAFFLVVLISGFAGYSQVAVDESKMMTSPAISGNHIAFAYANDLWVANLDGSNVMRLTSNDGNEFNPCFSPNGKTIAFSGSYDGNVDVFTIPVEGGIPKRITWHPAADVVIGFTPDGKYILFTTAMESFTYALPQLYKIPVEGGIPERVPLQSVTSASFSPDGNQVAYNPLYPAWQQWKNYRGGRVSTIWICNLPDLSVDQLEQPKGFCNDFKPMWYKDQVYFLSDRNGEFNLFSFNPQGKEIRQLTGFKDFPINNAAMGEGKILFERAGCLSLYDLSSGKVSELHFKVPDDLSDIRPRFVKGSKYIRYAGISPSGARAVFEVRGEIITVPAEKGDPRNLTETTGANERSPIWSPKGDQIAWFSDESGEYMLNVFGPGSSLKKYPLNGAGFYRSPVWSPDGKKICYVDNSFSIYIIDLASGVITKFNTEPMYDVFNMMVGNWSPDSKWIAYTMITKTNFQRVYLYSLDKNMNYPVTDGMSDCTEPAFDKSGKYLYFFGSTDAGPVRDWFDLSSADMQMSNSIYITVLARDSVSPLMKESDEEKGMAAPVETKPMEKDKGKKASKEKKEEPKADASLVRIDIDGLANRILALPIGAGAFVNLQAGNDGEIYFMEGKSEPGGFRPPFKLHKFTLKTRKDNVVLQNLNDYSISNDKKKILFNTADNWFITDLSDNITADKGKLNLDVVEVKIDLPSEWKQMFDEAWRINRDFFYDPGMQGADWPAMRTKYEQFLPYLSCRDDLNRLITWLCSELSVGHSFTFGGDQYAEPKSVPVGLLGADYSIENNRYRFKKIYGGLNWTPDLRSPLTEPGIKVSEGDYLIAVNGKDLKYPVSVFSLFENTAGKIVTIMVAPNPDGSGSHEAKVVPVSDEMNLRNRFWVEQNIRKVEEATGGRVGYVYVPNTSSAGHEYFKRYYFPQANKEAIIIDERFNGGGSLADYYTDLLRRPYLNFWATRFGADIKSASSSIQGPKVMITNEYAGSGGDYLPWMFRKEGLGKIVGKRTWGGLVGMLGFPALMDGGYVTAPNLAFWDEDGWRIENEGITPDISIDQLPSELAKGKDPQLDKAIELVLDELKANPPKAIKRPPYPVRVRKD